MTLEVYRMCVLRSALKLETKGLKRRGRSAYSIIKQEYGLKGSREHVLKQLTGFIDQIKEANDARQTTCSEGD